jgi:geranylgeranyl diphosphate synthase, type I
MIEYFAPIRKRIVSALEDFFASSRQDLTRINELGPDVADKLLDFSRQGKMIRGCLVHLGYILSRSPAESAPPPASIPLAGAAMELFQSGLLVHDDIMDRDLTRRGRPSLFAQYAEQARREGHPDPNHLGESLGICAGDVAYFLAFELLSRMSVSPETNAAVQGLFARELAAVGIAQMQDVAWGATDTEVTEEQITRMYTYKTGRYSFCLPLMVGALLAGARGERLRPWEILGEHMGLLFQIRDDELGLFGTEAETGKPVGTDVREGKKTLYYARLMAAAKGRDRAWLTATFGNRDATESDLDFVRTCATSLGIRDGIAALVLEKEARARSLIDAIDTGSPADRAALVALLDFTTTRRQ